jgi:hypothetical protein
VYCDEKAVRRKEGIESTRAWKEGLGYEGIRKAGKKRIWNSGQ